MEKTTIASLAILILALSILVVLDVTKANADNNQKTNLKNEGESCLKDLECLSHTCTFQKPLSETGICTNP